MENKNIKKTLRIFGSLQPTDWLSFNQIYSPLLNEEESIFFMTLHSQKQINKQLSIELSYELSRFLNNNKMTEEKFKDLCAKLSKLGLIKFLYKSIDCDKGNQKTKIEVLIKLEKIKSIKEALNDRDISQKLKKNLNKEKYLELVILSESENKDLETNFQEYKLDTVDELFEINFEETSPKEEEKLENKEIDKETFCLFYDGVFKLLNNEFSLNNEVLEIVKEQTNSNNISMEKLQKFAYMAAIKTEKGKYEISNKTFLFLVEKEIKQKNSKPFKILDHQNFWRNIKVSENEQINEDFENLFYKYECEELYKLLTQKHKAPDSLNKWVKECLSTKGFNYPLLNSVMSFVTILLKKLPVKYLTKVTETLHSNNAVSKEGVIQLVKDVIDSDIENGKNRLNAKTIDVFYEQNDNNKNSQNKNEFIIFQGI